ncbi:MAG: hypothetical protein VKQ33_12330 [Candidatus Sericytochromatia bacterium]|nr:hypothetical protein [Candidatus Sericytochromatia bacterium]
MQANHVAWALVALVVLAGGAGCAALLGREHLPDPPYRPAPEQPQQAARDAAAELVATWLGPGGYVVTARQHSGRIARFVSPFGVDVTCLEVTLTAAGTQAITVLAGEATLQVGSLPPRPAIGLEAYRRRWPRWAVSDETQAHDRKAAYEHVLANIWLDRRLEPGESRRAVFSFPTVPLAGSPALQVPYRTDGGSRGVLQVTWEVD